MVFAAECLRRGLDPGTAIESPIDAIANSPIIDPIPMDREQILNLWYEGLTRPEIMALGATYPEFQQAIKIARTAGDPRAYYRENRWSRLPWAIDLTTKAKQKAKEHRIISNEQERRTMKKGEPTGPGSPLNARHNLSAWDGRPRRDLNRRRPPAPSSVGPAFVSKLVDGLVAVLPQIDEAKRELDKRFIPKSDILRTEVNKD